MSEIALRAQDLSKRYLLYERRRDRAIEALFPFAGKRHHDFMALDSVSFEIGKAETVGIIGRNGSGKSTLLKVICGVLTPTTGEIEVNGTVSSILELGAGFNPLMTGIENIFLYGTLMGLRRRDIEAKLDAILAFADLGDFITQPMKHFSSGMFARLAFATTMNVDPDVLIIDEALSVGDGLFQRKCLKRFAELRDSGCTILLVSHDLDLIKSNTERALYLRGGRLAAFGATDAVVNEYRTELFQQKAEIPKREISDTIEPSGDCVFYENSECLCYGNGGARIRYLAVHGLRQGNVFVGGEAVEIELVVDWDVDDVLRIAREQRVRENIIVGLRLEDRRRIEIMAFNTFLSGHLIDAAQHGNCRFSFRFTMPRLYPSDFFLAPAIALGEHDDHTQLRWCDNFGILKSSPPNAKDFLGVIAWPYLVKAYAPIA
ncbi:ABC transporter ATP-binding protein [uncultured Thiodictyon sp.]|uniref:ABC transporter ATP-binding protein n=1 Tax=uncultured Thiodictyon sp. TaxID=1846217 RepID=UPI0025D19D9A|nr:ABC transporter ATP-binding protein [uncultured Thiodictyon sp.]